ncbi:MAG: hypothetical protein MUF37_08005 [Methanoregulaceae archaeon]|jgi:hypothetical protein|nr:hypothetical protein [Methanoregulaceae archaeon]
MKCAVCDESGTSFTKVNHQELGVVLLCNACLVKKKTVFAPYLIAAGADACGNKNPFTCPLR